MTATSAGKLRIPSSPDRSHASPKIFCVENHDEALPLWRAWAGTNRIVVHVDAHHDMWWVPPGQPVTIANFISPALQDGILREIYWVVPDRSWDSAENRRKLLHNVRRIQQDVPGGGAPMEIAHDRISTTLAGKPLHICAVAGLPKFTEDVLLDLDVDYMIYSRVTYGAGDPHPSFPWCWPAGLAAALQARGVTSDLITIAYSVEGGYTPLRWKYLGDELQTCLDPDAGPEAAQGMRSMRAGAEAAASRQFEVAEREYRRAAAWMPESAAPQWHLAFLYLDQGRVAEGRQMYQRAIELDSRYRTVYNSSALWDYWGRRSVAAEREYHRTLALDPGDAFAHLALGWLAMDQKRWRDAEHELQSAVEICPDLRDAHRSLGRVFSELGKWPDAILAYQKSLTLARNGRPSYARPPIISVENARWDDFDHFNVFVELAKLSRKVGDRERAAQYFRMAAASGVKSMRLHGQLARLALGQREWNQAWRETGHALRQFALRVVRMSKKLVRGLGKPVLHAYELWRVR